MKISRRFYGTGLLLFAITFLLYSCHVFPYLKYFTTLKDGKFHRFGKHAYLTGSINRYRSCYDVHYYDLDLDVDIVHERIRGRVDIYYSAQANFDTLLLDLHPQLKIDSLGDKNARCHRNKDALFIIYKDGVRAGERKELSIWYSGKPVNVVGRGAVVWDKDRHGNALVNTTCQGLGAHLWWPCKDLLYDEADSASISVNIPKGLFCVSNGKLRKREVNGRKERFTWFVASTINVYNVSFNIGNYLHFQLPYKNESGLHGLDFYVLPDNYFRAQEQFKQCADVISFYEKMFGEYPWWKDGYKMIETKDKIGGMEHQSAILYGDHYTNTYWGVDYIIVHETAHEWWGNSVTAMDYNDIWLHEGFANYCEFLYLEHKWGHDVYMNAMVNEMYYSGSIKNKVPVIKPANVRYSAWINAKRDENIYPKGAIFLHCLRSCIKNDSLFFNLLRTFYARHKYGHATTGDLLNLVNEMTGNDYKWLFDQYLYDYRVPKLQYYYDLTAQPVKLFYRWSYAHAGLKLPVESVSGKDTTLIYPTAEFNSLVSGDPKQHFIGARDAYFFAEHIQDKR